MSESRGIRAAGPALGLGLVLLVLAGAALFLSDPPPVLQGTLDSWRPSPGVRARLVELREDRAAAPAPEDASRELVAAWRAASAAPWIPGPSVKRRIQSAESRFRQVAAAFIEAHGVAAYGAVGEVLAAGFDEALGQVVEQAGEEHKGNWLARHRQDPLVMELRGIGGEFPERSLSSGLMAPRGPWDPDRRLVARILWTTYWFESGRKGLAAEAMAPEERLLLRLWKIEDAAHLGWVRRQEIMGEVRAAAPGYPADFVLGVLAAREGLIQEAETAFERSLAAGIRPELSRRWLAWLAGGEGP